MLKDKLLHIYDWLSAHRRVLWVVFAVVMTVLAVLAATLHYNEEIMDFLPVTDEDREAMKTFQSQEAASRLVLIVEGDSLRDEALEAVVEAVNEQIPYGEINDEPVNDEMVDALYALMPYYISDSTYGRLDSLFTPAAIQAALQRDKTILSTPGTSFLIPAIQHDPLGLVDLSTLNPQLSTQNRS